MLADVDALPRRTGSSAAGGRDASAVPRATDEADRTLRVTYGGAGDAGKAVGVDIESRFLLS